MEKLVLLISDNINNNDIKIDNNTNNTNTDINILLEKNKFLNEKITKHKDKITYYHNNKLWDKFKKFGNEYELIFTSPNIGSNISSYNPVSRAFFKLWEIFIDYKTEIFKENKKMRCLFLAEGPGGFAEAFIKYRNKNGFSDDDLNGITLKAFDDKSIPEWKIDKDFMKRIKISYGEDDTGNLYHFKNINYLLKLYSPNSMDLITADGGFDSSSDFNSQEELSFRLILCEFLAAVLCQKIEGSFILKVFDLFTINSLKLIQIIKEFYTNIYIIKPMTSRPANSEKYLLCTGYKKGKQSLIERIIILVSNYSDKKRDEFFESIDFNVSILNSLILYNEKYISRQIYYIDRTIEYIEKFKDIKKIKSDEMKKILNDHTRISKEWCKKYDLV